MKLFIKILPFAIAAFVAAGCSNSGAKDTAKKQDSVSANQPLVRPPQTAKGIAIQDDHLNAIYEHYVALSEALIDGNMAQAKISSNAMEAGAREMPGGGRVAAAAAKITAASTIGRQRSAYSALSNEMVNLIKKSGLKRGEIYVDYCPMALNDKGAYWLSSGKGIRNPYFGDEMLTCGEVKETIK